MAIKKFLYGMGVGILGCNVYPLIKNKLCPIAVNMLKSAIAVECTTKSFIQEVNEQAIERRQERFKRISENFEPSALNSNDETSEHIELLKKQLRELKDKIQKDSFYK